MEGIDLSFHVSFSAACLPVYLDVVLAVHNRHGIEFLVVHIGQSTQYFPHMQLQLLVVYWSLIEETRFSVVDYFLDLAVVALQDEGQLALLLESQGQLGHLFTHFLDCLVRLIDLFWLFFTLLLFGILVAVIYSYLIELFDYFQLAFLVLHVYISSNPQNYYNIQSLYHLIFPFFIFFVAQTSFQSSSIIHQFYLILFQTSMSTLHPSQLEKRFIATSMYKRSKQYFDINKLNHIETKQEKSRRKPYLQSNTESLDNKFQESFISTQTKINMRLQTEFDKHQKRFFHDQKDQTETNYTIQGQFLSNFRRKGKTLDMSKMLSRNYYERQPQQCKDQSHFCNFKEYRIPNNHNIDFSKFFVPKIPKRKQSGQHCVKCKSKSKHVADSKMDELNADICGKIHETLIFDESLFKTMVDYKKYNKEKTEREEQVTIEKDIDRIIVGENMTRKNPKSAAAEFYHGLNKWNSAQMDNRLMKQNQYFLKVYNTKNQKQIDWSTIKRKTDLIQKRKREIMMRKNIPDIKGEICDEIYFRRNHH